VPFDARPLSMGGAFSAVANDTSVGYWNPAGLGTLKGFGMRLAFGNQTEWTGNILENVNDVAKFADDYAKLQTAQKEGKALGIKEFASMTSAMKNINALSDPGKGLLTNINASANIRMGKILLTLNNYSYIGIKPHPEFGFYLGSGTASGLALSKTLSTDTGVVIGSTDSVPTGYGDVSAELASEMLWLRPCLKNAGVPDVDSLTNEQIANALINASITAGTTPAELLTSINIISDNETIIRSLLSAQSGSFSDNESYVAISGVNVSEINGGSAWSLPWLKDLYGGVNVKIMMGTVGYYKHEIFKSELEVSDIASKITTHTKQSTTFGLDGGLMYDKKKSFFRSKLGLVVRNIISPTFAVPDIAKTAGEKDITLKPQVRLGYAFYPFNFWSISADYDITSNETLIPGYNSQNFAVGTEFNLFNSPAFNIPLRAGMYKNLADSKSSSVYTGGFGMMFGGFGFDLAGAMSLENVNTSATETLPQNMSVQMSLVISF